MNSPDVAAALSAGAPDAAGKLYDAHAEALFQYCWLTLRDRQQARTAVCDALVQAGARVAELSDPATLRAWLFALVRAECHHRPLPSLGDTDERIARPEQTDAALRIMAWNSVISLDLLQRQALDLVTRHGMTESEVSLILGLPLPGATELLNAARRSPGASATTSPAAGGADAVASGKRAGTRAGGQTGQTGQMGHRTVTVAMVPSTGPGRARGPASNQVTARLTVSPARLDLDQGSSGDLTLTASGGSVSWSAAASSGVSVSPASGQLGSGHSATVTVTVPRAGTGGGSATVSVNGAQVSVSWSATPASPAPSGSSGASGAPGTPGAAGSSPPPARRHHHHPVPGGSPAPAAS